METAERPRWRYTSDRTDPCGYCVQWVEGEDPFMEDAYPVLPSGPVERVYRYVHPGCAQAVADYVAEAQEDR